MPSSGLDEEAIAQLLQFASEQIAYFIHVTETLAEQLQSQFPLATSGRDQVAVVLFFHYRLVKEAEKLKTTGEFHGPYSWL